MGSLQSKLDGMASELNVPAFTALVHGWPMLALFASLILLIVHSVAHGDRAAEEGKSEKLKKTEIVGTGARDLDDAVGDGLEPVEDEEAGWGVEIEYR